MSTYPVDVKSANHSSVATHAIFAGPARVVGIYMSKEKNVGASAVTIKKDTTVVAHFDVPATDNTNGAGLATYVQFPGTGIRCDTSLNLTIGTSVTSCTIFFGQEFKWLL